MYKTICIKARVSDKSDTINGKYSFCFGHRLFLYNLGEPFINCFYDGISDNCISVEGKDRHDLNKICDLVEDFVFAEIKRAYNID